MRSLSVLAILALLISCAQRVPITGGPKDVWPPKLIKSSPDTFSTNFNSDRIRLDFDEYVNVKSASKNVLITPVLRYDPYIYATSKRVMIKDLDDSLWPNTTYVIEFNEAIQDITEKNAAKGLRYVFSTGDYVDSLEVSGVAINAFDLNPIEDAFVFLYENWEDSTPYKDIPRYIGRTSESGSFTIRNIKQGEYKVFMCSDENRNYLFDGGFELIDFTDDPIVIGADSTPFIKGRLFEEKREFQYLKGFGSTNAWSFYMSFNLPVDTLVLEAIPGSKDIISNAVRDYDVEGDSIMFWLSDSSLHNDTVKFKFETDTLPWDTVEIAFFKEKEAKRLRLKDNLSKGKLNLGQNLELHISFPVIDLDESKMKLFADSLPVEFKFETNFSKRRIVIEHDWKEKTKYRLLLDSACLTDINGFSNDSMNIEFETFEKRYYGTLDISLNLKDDEYGILQIMDPKNKVLEEVYMKGRKKQYFEFMHPAEYKLKFLMDVNKNEKWDSGNYLQGIHAEPVSIYPGMIKIRSNWDQVIEWKLD